MDYYVKSVIPVIESNYENFTALEKNIADFFMKNEEKMDFSAKEIAKPAYLHLKGDKNYLELAAREMKAMTKGGAMLSGHIQTVKCRSSKDVLTDFPIQDKKIQIPFEDFEFEQLSETEITGQIQLFMTSSVGKKRMPESMATLILKI